MSILAIISALFKLMVMFFSAKTEQNQQIKKRKEKAYNDIKKGIADDNPSAITAAFARMRK